MHPADQHWPLTDRVWRQFETFDRVMKLVQVDLGRAVRQDAGMAIATARNICLRCPVQEKCLALLERNAGPDEVMAICPNANFLSNCRLVQD
ncbi:MAG TPA: DUF6455 family protein [Devosia sp.]|nr:DUF6455 family protein [Devosia sp.]